MTTKVAPMHQRCPLEQTVWLILKKKLYSSVHLGSKPAFQGNNFFFFFFQIQFTLSSVETNLIIKFIFSFYREISLEILRQEPVGSFLVRQSTSKPGCYALSVRVPKDKSHSTSGIAHYLITQSNRGFKIKVSLFFLLFKMTANQYWTIY